VCAHQRTPTHTQIKRRARTVQITTPAPAYRGYRYLGLLVGDVIVEKETCKSGERGQPMNVRGLVSE
jgi:hypothetical protein